MVNVQNGQSLCFPGLGFVQRSQSWMPLLSRPRLHRFGETQYLQLQQKAPGHLFKDLSRIALPGELHRFFKNIFCHIGWEQNIGYT